MEPGPQVLTPAETGQAEAVREACQAGAQWQSPGEAALRDSGTFWSRNSSAAWLTALGSPGRGPESRAGPAELRHGPASECKPHPANPAGRQERKLTSSPEGTRPYPDLERRARAHHSRPVCHSSSKTRPAGPLPLRTMARCAALSCSPCSSPAHRSQRAPAAAQMGLPTPAALPPGQQAAAVPQSQPPLCSTLMAPAATRAPAPRRPEGERSSCEMRAHSAVCIPITHHWSQPSPLAAYVFKLDPVLRA